MALFDKQQVIDADLLTEMLSPQTGPDGQKRSYGIGFRIGQFQGHRTFEHGGAVYGYSTQFRGLPEQKLGVIAVSSLDVSNGFVSELTNTVLEMALAKRDGNDLRDLISLPSIDKASAREASGLFQKGEETRRLYESGGRLLLSGGTYTQEIRQFGSFWQTDDVLSSGTIISDTTDQLVFGLFKDHITWKRIEDKKPEPCSAPLKEYIGEYGWPHNTLFVYEKQGRLWCLIEWVFHYPLTEVSKDVLAFPNYGLYHEEQLLFRRDSDGLISNVIAAEVDFRRLEAGPEAGETFKIQPLLPADRLREIALAAEPRMEARDFLKPDLVDLNVLEPAIKLGHPLRHHEQLHGHRFLQRAASVNATACGRGGGSSASETKRTGVWPVDPRCLQTLVRH